MAAIIDTITDTFPANDDINVPLITSITITFDREMDEDRLQEDFFVEGPDTDQFIGPGQIVLQENVSQGEVDDFLRSPGYQGIVSGTFDFSESVAGTNTKLKFTPTQPMAPSTLYTVGLADTLDLAGNDVTGFVSFSFTTGTGSIDIIPSSTSSSILSTTVIESSQPTLVSDALALVSVVPEDQSVEHDPATTKEIILTFNKDLDAATVTDDKVTVTTVKATDHPNVSTTANGELAKTLTVNGKVLTITI